mmetsp:Transcript_19750/g.50102  ORF Transcript_19750/g.50102 Transcript_19750/m.50102 type:complete len:259 (+) Transcript_19750:872-1648(+)
MLHTVLVTKIVLHQIPSGHKSVSLDVLEQLLVAPQLFLGEQGASVSKAALDFREDCKSPNGAASVAVTTDPLIPLLLMQRPCAWIADAHQVVELDAPMRVTSLPPRPIQQCTTNACRNDFAVRILALGCPSVLACIQHLLDLSRIIVKFVLLKPLTEMVEVLVQGHDFGSIWKRAHRSHVAMHRTHSVASFLRHRRPRQTNFVVVDIRRLHDLAIPLSRKPVQKQFQCDRTGKLRALIEPQQEFIVSQNSAGQDTGIS